ncbi:hypothetical protein ABPG72_014978 [Tetrahymena utriculariae]
MSQFSEYLNVLLLSLENTLEQNLYFLHKALQETQYQLIVEFQGNAINRNYDTIISYLLIFYNYINYIKRNDPMFEATITLPKILNYESKLHSIEYDVIFVGEFLNVQEYQKQVIIKFNHEDSEVLQEISRYLKEDVLEQVDTVKGKKQGKYQDISIQSLRRVILGGTFDHLHNGHKIMLSAALLLAIPSDTDIVLGLTGTELLKNKKNKELLQSFEYRRHRIIQFQQLFAPQTKFYIFELMEPMGPLRDKEFDGVVISHETLQSSFGINKFRKENGLSELPLYIVDIISQNKSQCGNDFSEKASSTTVRNYLLEKNSLTPEQFGYLNQKWRSIFVDYDSHKEVLNKWFDSIRLKYSENYRYYHTLSHIYCMLQLSEQIKFNHSVNVQLAIWFHDVIYNPKAHDNEKRSAQYYILFDKELKQNNIIVGNSEIVEAYILQTEKHLSDQIPEQILNDLSFKQDLEYFLDLDLCILGLSQDIYEKYSQDIIREYSHYSNEQIKNGRTKILENFLNQNLFKTEQFQQRYGEQAKTNIKREIQNLQKL